jgi:hypothetical protein
MTEQEWLKCTDPRMMLAIAKNTATWRQLRLFLSTHLRLAPSSPTHVFRRQLADVLEGLADGLPGSDEALTTMVQELNDTHGSSVERQYFEGAAYLRECADLLKLARQPDTGTEIVAMEFDGPTLHDIFGNRQFRSTILNPACLTPTVVKIAQAI